jgi:hypothetical protein
MRCTAVVAEIPIFGNSATTIGYVVATFNVEQELAICVLPLNHRLAANAARLGMTSANFIRFPPNTNLDVVVTEIKTAFYFCRWCAAVGVNLDMGASVGAVKRGDIVFAERSLVALAAIAALIIGAVFCPAILTEFNSVSSVWFLKVAGKAKWSREQAQRL